LHESIFENGKMKKVELDKISSVTKNLNLGYHEEVTRRVSTEMGTVLAAQILQDKSVYNELELPSGRLSKLKKDDIIAVALGGRAGLKGFAGHLPKSLKADDVIHLLNLGGVAGVCTSANVQEVGEPLRIRVLGGIAREGKLLNINQAKLFEPVYDMKNDIPLILTTGASMDAGKTTVAAEIIKTLSRIGMKLAGAKVTGVGTLRDLYKMEDYGVYESVSFIDSGMPSTANVDEKLLVGICKGALDHLAKGNPDAIMVEFGDGIMGRYGVMSILKDPQIQKNVRLHIGCAREPVGAIKLAELCRDIGVPLDILSGPVTDNEVGKEIIKEATGLMTYNAFSPRNDWLDLVIARWAV